MRSRQLTTLACLTSVALLLFSSSGAAAQEGTQPASVGAQTILYDQTNNQDASTGGNSQNYTPSLQMVTYSADDFVIPNANPSWTINKITTPGSYQGNTASPVSLNLFLYGDSGAGLPETEIYSATVSGASVGETKGVTLNTFIITPTAPIILAPGPYWMTVQANKQDGQWFWRSRTTQSNNAAAFQNPDGLFAAPGAGGCHTWARLQADCQIIPLSPSRPDLIFKLEGTNNSTYPAPNILRFSPSSVPINNTTTLTILGSNFVISSTVTAGATSKAVTFINNSKIRITLNPANVPSLGTVTITVTNPPPGGGSSSKQLPVVANLLFLPHIRK